MDVGQLQNSQSLQIAGQIPDGNIDFAHTKIGALNQSSEPREGEWAATNALPATFTSLRRPGLKSAGPRSSSQCQTRRASSPTVELNAHIYVNPVSAPRTDGGTCKCRFTT